MAEGFEGMNTAVKQIVVLSSSSTITVVCPFTVVNQDIFLIITGRKPLYLRCHEEGHVRRDGMMPYCQQKETETFSNCNQNITGHLSNIEQNE